MSFASALRDLSDTQLSITTRTCLERAYDCRDAHAQRHWHKHADLCGAEWCRRGLIERYAELGRNVYEARHQRRDAAKARKGKDMPAGEPATAEQMYRLRQMAREYARGSLDVGAN